MAAIKEIFPILNISETDFYCIVLIMAEVTVRVGLMNSRLPCLLSPRVAHHGWLVRTGKLFRFQKLKIRFYIKFYITDLWF